MYHNELKIMKVEKYCINVHFEFLPGVSHMLHNLHLHLFLNCVFDHFTAISK